MGIGAITTRTIGRLLPGDVAYAISVPTGASILAKPETALRKLRAYGLFRQASRLITEANSLKNNQNNDIASQPFIQADRSEALGKNN